MLTKPHWGQGAPLSLVGPPVASQYHHMGVPFLEWRTAEPNGLEDHHLAIVLQNQPYRLILNLLPYRIISDVECHAFPLLIGYRQAMQQPIKKDISTLSFAIGCNQERSLKPDWHFQEGSKVMPGWGYGSALDHPLCLKKVPDSVPGISSLKELRDGKESWWRPRRATPVSSQ